MQFQNRKMDQGPCTETSELTEVSIVPECTLPIGTGALWILGFCLCFLNVGRKKATFLNCASLNHMKGLGRVLPVKYNAMWNIFNRAETVLPAV